MNTKSERVLGWVSPALLLGVLAALFVFQARFRAVEAILSSQTVAALAHTRTAAVPDRAVLFFNLGTRDALGLQITPECTSAFLIAPLMAVAVVMLRLRPAITRRILLALLLGAVLLVLTNQLRITLVVWLVDAMGVDSGYYWGHTLMGSAVSVVGGAVSLGVFVRTVGARRAPAVATGTDLRREPGTEAGRHRR